MFTICSVFRIKEQCDEPCEHNMCWTDPLLYRYIVAQSEIVVVVAADTIQSINIVCCNPNKQTQQHDLDLTTNHQHQ